MSKTHDILTDGNGRPFVKPEPADYADAVSYLRAMWAYRDAVTDCANKAFDAQLVKSMRRGRN